MPRFYAQPRAAEGGHDRGSAAEETSAGTGDEQPSPGRLALVPETLRIEED